MSSDHKGLQVRILPGTSTTLLVSYDKNMPSPGVSALFSATYGNVWITRRRVFRAIGRVQPIPQAWFDAETFKRIRAN